jgi:hypothetical protein
MSFERAEFEFEFRDEAGADQAEKQEQDITLHVKEATCDLTTTIVTCTAVFAWDWAAKSLLRDEPEFVWTYALCTCLISTAVLIKSYIFFSVICNSCNIGSRQMVCCLTCKCNPEHAIDPSVLKDGRQRTAQSCMVMLLHNLALLMGLTLSYAISVSLEGPLEELDAAIAILIKWSVTVGVVGVTLLVVRFRRLLMCKKRQEARAGQAFSTRKHEVVHPIDYVDHR